MSKPPTSLRPSDALVVAAGLLLVVGLQVWSDEPAPRPLYVVEKQVDTFGPTPRVSHQEATEAYSAFLSTRGYYGAFASADDGGFGWADNHSSQQRADAKALETCAKHSEKCQITARLRPQVEISFEGHPLSQTQAMALDRFHSLPNHKAIALSSNGTWGAAWDRTAPFVAKQAALRQCRKNLTEQGLEEQGGIACRLVEPY